MYKEHDVVMLPTKKASNILLSESGLLLYPTTQESYNFVRAHGKPKDQHLYVLSDDEIIIGNWFYCNDTKKIFQCFSSKNGILNDSHSNYKKIIATTDSSLKIIIPRHNDFDSELELPQIPTSFIQYFVEQYNIGNIITKVNIEYKKIESTCNCYYTKFCKAPKHLENGELCRDQEHSVLKINPDNTINFKSIKDNWDKKEHEHSLRLAFKAGIEYALSFKHGIPSKPNIDDWIKENL